MRKTEEILLYNGKIYDRFQAKTIIKEEAEKLIPNCTEYNRLEVINKIEAQTYTDLENFDADPNIVTTENGVLDLKVLQLKPHEPENLSRVLLPVDYITPQFEIKDKTIFEDIEKNIGDTLFYKAMKNSMIHLKPVRLSQNHSK